MTKHHRFPPEVRQRAIRMVLENQKAYNSQWAVVCSIVPKIGRTPETLRIWIHQQEPVSNDPGALTAGSPIDGMHGIYPASRGRESVLRFTECPGCGSLNTQAKYSTGKPERFSGMNT